jgi:rabenosyn-5
MDAEAARALQPLLEQEALLEGFLAEAGARRQLEDARSLRENLAEIRAEIARVMQGADVGAPGGAGRRVNGGARARAGRGSRG